MEESMVQGHCHIEFTGLRRLLCPAGHGLLLRLESGNCTLKGGTLPAGACVLLAGGAAAELHAPNGAQLTEYLFTCTQAFLPAAVLETPPPEVTEWLATPTAALPAGFFRLFAGKKAPPPALTAVRAYIEHNYTSDITLDGLAAYAGCSKYTLIRGFKTHWGCTPMDYVSLIRLQNAQRLLTSTYVSVELVAELCGFSSASYLITRFKKAYGQTPNAYRQSNPA